MSTYSPLEMPIEFSWFRWRRCNEGYYFDDEAEDISEDQDQGKPPFLLPISYSPQYTVINPLDEPHIFTEFASLNLADITTAKKEIIGFANQYGMLLDGDEASLVDSRKHKTFPTITNPLFFWLNQIWIMKNTFRIWNWLKGGNSSMLEKIFTFGKDNIYYAWGEPEDLDTYRTAGMKYNAAGDLLTNIKGLLPPNNRSLFDSPNHYLMNKIRADNYLFPAQLLVQKTINRQIIKWPTIPVLLMDKDNILKQYFKPTSLLACLWFQFFQVVTGEQKIIKCPFCGKWLDVTESPLKEFHDRCAIKFRVYKHRKLPKVKELLSEGLPLPDVSTEIGISISILERWLRDGEK